MGATVLSFAMTFVFVITCSHSCLPYFKKKPTTETNRWSTTTMTMMTTTKQPTSSSFVWKRLNVAGQGHAEAVNMLFDKMVDEGEDQTNWENEEDWLEKESISTDDLSEEKTFMEDLSGSTYELLVNTVVQSYKMLDIDVNMLRNPIAEDVFTEFFFNTTNGGIGWCRLGRVKGVNKDNFDMAYNVLSFTIDNSSHELVERVRRFKVHKAILKFKKLYRDAMVVNS